MKQEQCPPNSASRLPLFLPILVLAITAIPWAQCQRYDQGSGGRHNNRFALNSVPSHSNNFNKFKHDILLKKRSSGGGDEEEEEDGGEFNESGNFRYHPDKAGVDATSSRKHHSSRHSVAQQAPPPPSPQGYVPKTDVVIIPARYWNDLPAFIRNKIGISTLTPFGGAMVPGAAMMPYTG